MTEEGGRRAEVLVFVLAAAAEALLLALVAIGHGVNPDEGFYLAGAWRVLQGQHLYADFFFPQMPYLPYLQAAQIALAGPSILAGRIVSVLPGALTLGLLAAAAWRWTRRRGVVVIVVLAYAAHILFWNYLTVAKTYGLANFWLVWAFLLIASRSSGARSFAAGLCGGIAIGVRLPAVAVVATLFAWQAWRQPRRLPFFLAGAGLALLPCLWIASRDFDAFWFGNWGFHNLRGEISGLAPVVRQKLLVLGRWLWLPQNLLLGLIAVWGARVGDERSRAALACAAALAAVYLSATPTYLEYTAQMIPFLLLAALPALPQLLSRRRWWIAGTAVYGVSLVLALRPAADDSPRARKLDLWRLERVDQVTRYLRSEAAPGEAVLSWWEGYPVLARRTGFDGVGFWESNVAKKLGPAQRQRYHVLDRLEIRQLVDAQKPRLVLFPDGVWDDFGAALEHGYHPVERFGALQVYRRNDRVGAAPDSPVPSP